MPSRQPTHHGYAVNVKDSAMYSRDTSPLEGEEVQALYDMRAEDFWELVQEVGTDHGFKHVYSEGRMAGWAVPDPQPHTDDVEAWERDRFRPFERGVLALMEACREDFEADLAAAIETAKREPAEAAYWAACDVVTVA